MQQPTVPELSTSAAARRAGVANEELERAQRQGTLVRVRQGAYAVPDRWQNARPEARHLALVRAAQLAARTRIVFSHESAAALLEIPLVGPWPSRPHATTAGPTGRRSTNAVVWHNLSLDGDVIEHDGYLVTSPLRTVLDLLTSREFVSGVVSLDHVLAKPAVYRLDRRVLLREIERRRPFRNAERAKRVGEFARGISQSPFESLSMVRIVEGGYPEPTQQKRFDIAGRTYFTDFFFEDENVAAESDGKSKYRDEEFLRGRTPERALLDEKDREDAIRSVVSGFVRWGWDDALRGDPLYRKLERAGIHRIRTRRPRRTGTRR